MSFRKIDKVGQMAEYLVSKVSEESRIVNFKIESFEFNAQYTTLLSVIKFCLVTLKGPSLTIFDFELNYE